MISILVLAATLALSGCAFLIHQEADRHAAAGHPEQVLRTLEEGVRKYPDDATLRARYLRARETTLATWLAEAQRQRMLGRGDEAERLAARGLAVDPSNTRMAQLLEQLRRDRRLSVVQGEAQSLLDRGQQASALRVVDEGLKIDPRNEPLMTLKRQIQSVQREQQVKAASIGIAEQRPISLDFRDAGLRQVLDVVTRHSGLNFVLDKDIRHELRVTVYLKNVRVEDALDLIVSTHQLARKVLDDRTVLLYPNTPEKQREYQEQVIRVFYLSSAEAKGAALFLKSMLKLKEPFVDERSNMLALRDSPETVALAERLINLYDTQEPEVVLELEVLEVRSTRLNELGVKLPSSVTFSPLAPTSGGTLTVANLRGLGEDRIGVSVGGVTVNLRREVGDFEVLANPRVRAKNREKAKVLIGDKVPIITTTTGQTGFVSDTVTYLDVGLKLEIEPTVFANDEVMIRMALEVGSLAGQLKTASGTVAYQISTRNASTALRLKDGETQLLAGLLSKEDRASASRVPLAGDMPVLGRLFGSQLDDSSRTELVLAVTPRIVRNIRQPDPSEAELWVGTESYTRLRQVGGRVAPELMANGFPMEAGTKRPPKGDSGVGGQDAVASTVVGESNAEVRSSLDPVQSPAAARRTAKLRWMPMDTASATQPFTVTIAGDLGKGAQGMSYQLTAEPRLELLKAEAVGLWSTGEAEVSVSAFSEESSGAMEIGVIRNDGSLVTGDGPMVQLRLRAQKAGTYTLHLVRVGALGASGVRSLELPERLVVEVAP